MIRKFQKFVKIVEKQENLFIVYIDKQQDNKSHKEHSLNLQVATHVFWELL